MSATMLVWLAAAALYALFHFWYVGFRSKLTPEEIERVLAVVREHDPSKQAMFRRIFEEDTGREFYMVNLLKLHRQLPSGEYGPQVLMKYQKPFMAAMLRRGGHPIAMARAASPATESWGIDHADDWDAAVLVRYRSRRDLAEILCTPMFRSQHPYKLQAVSKTFAFMADPARIIIGGPRLVVPLALLCAAALLTLAMAHV
ncbi:MAG TPA: hypothetical protein VHE37_10865 [Nevskiaceae bacterium]|nr:hypothetical protein [Nevskiaceae bacterium]